jgi:hypothetical protein
MHNRKVVTSEAQGQLRETQIQEVEFRRWERREPRLLAGLGETYMGPSADASVETVELWVKAKAELKQYCSCDRGALEFFEGQKLVLINPNTGLPLGWVRRTSKAGQPWFLNPKTNEKQWHFPKGTDLYKFVESFEETLEEN